MSCEFFSGAILINQLIEKEMKEQNAQQKEKLDEIKNRASAIRQRHEEMQRRSGGQAAFTAQSYGQGRINTPRFFGNLILISSTLIDKCIIIVSYSCMY